MKLYRLLIGLVVVAALVGAAHLAQTTEPDGVKMANAAAKWVTTLTSDQKAKATLAFDDPERTNWHFVPWQTRDKKPMRKGLRLDEMNAEQKSAALEIVRAGTSDSGYTKATTIMSLESILHDLEKNGANVRDPQWYFFTVFGTPAKTGKWGWRVEGHHLSLNFTIDSGKIVSATPAFFGANPALVMAGERQGLRTLPEAEELAKQLFRSLDEDQKKIAFQEKAFPEIEEGKPAPRVGDPRGLPASKMRSGQRDILTKLVESYAARMPDPVAGIEMKEVKDAGIDKIHFAYSGVLEQGQKHTYRIQGPTFVVEFLNVQSDSAGNPANHIHSAWRTLSGDFGTKAQ
jgi:hypothetical protein